MEVMEDRRKGTCHFHSEGSLRISTLEKQVKTLCEKVGNMTKYQNIGIGLVFAAAIIVSLILGNMENVQADVTRDIAKHEAQITKDQDRMDKKMDMMTDNMLILQGQVYTLGSQIDNLRYTIENDRAGALAP